MIPITLPNAAPAAQPAAAVSEKTGGVFNALLTRAKELTALPGEIAPLPTMPTAQPSVPETPELDEELPSPVQETVLAIAPPVPRPETTGALPRAADTPHRIKYRSLTR